MSQATFSLTQDQETALKAFELFLLDPIENVFVLSGYSGCGKSTLVETILDRLPAFQKTIRLINPTAEPLEPRLTATTNKAAENLERITGMTVGTIHSFLGLRLQTDFRNNTSTLVENKNHAPPENVLLFIDEASYVDSNLLQKIFARTGKNTKIVFVGDPAQLTPVKSSSTPVFAAGFTGAALTQVVRQAEGNPIVDLSSKFRNTVNTGEFFSFKPDGNHVQHLARDDFMRAIEAEFTRPGWKYADSKILAWTNKRVVAYNQHVRNLAKGDPDFQVGDYAICNEFLILGKDSIKTDQLVQITAIEEETVFHEVAGNWMQLDGKTTRVFQPKCLADKNAAIKKARANDWGHCLLDMERWSDLRGAYASTINKSQGSTYDTVFIDLDDIRGCNSGDQIARMMYVGVSRARSKVVLTGDLAD
jgi:hypothetical protein